MTEQKSIDERLCNWSRWATGRVWRGADSITGAICESLRRAALGDVWSGHEVSDAVDSKDAVRIQLAMPRVTLPHRMLLSWHYIENARFEIAARKCAFHKCEFDQRLAAAQQAIEEATDKSHKC